MVDYGPNEGVPGDTIRGFKDHKVKSLLGAVGEVDVTADVDFTGLRKAAERRVELLYKNEERKPEQPKPRIHGPRPQGKFLMELGLGTRVQHIIESPTTTKEEANMAFLGMEKVRERSKKRSYDSTLTTSFSISKILKRKNFSARFARAYLLVASFLTCSPLQLVVDMGERFQVLAVAGGGMKGVKGVSGGKMIGF